MIKRGRVPSVERVRLLCQTLGLEFYVGPPRDVPVSVATLLELGDDCSEEAAVRAIKQLIEFDARLEGKLEASRELIFDQVMATLRRAGYVLSTELVQNDRSGEEVE